MTVERWSHFRDGSSRVTPDGEWVKFDDFEARASGYLGGARDGTKVMDR